MHAIPSDWEEEMGWTRIMFCVPNSPHWHGLAEGLTTTFSYGRFWDGKTGNISDIQEIGRRIRDTFFMDCNDDFTRMADALESIRDHLDHNGNGIAKILYDDSQKDSVGLIALQQAIEALEPDAIDEMSDFLEFLQRLGAVIPDLNFRFPSLFQIMLTIMDIRYRRVMMANGAMIAENTRYIGNAISPAQPDPAQEEADVTKSWAEKLLSGAMLAAITVLDPSPSGEIAIAAKLAIGAKSLLEKAQSLWATITGGSQQTAALPADSVTQALRDLVNKEACCDDPDTPLASQPSSITIPLDSEKCYNSKAVIGIVQGVLEILTGLDESPIYPSALVTLMVEWLEMDTSEGRDFARGIVMHNRVYGGDGSRFIEPAKQYAFADIETIITVNQQSLLTAIYQSDNAVDAYNDVYAIIDPLFPEPTGGDNEDVTYKKNTARNIAINLFTQGLINNIFYENWRVDAESIDTFVGKITATCGSELVVIDCPTRTYSQAHGMPHYDTQQLFINAGIDYQFLSTWNNATRYKVTYQLDFDHGIRITALTPGVTLEVNASRCDGLTENAP